MLGEGAEDWGEFPVLFTEIPIGFFGVVSAEADTTGTSARSVQDPEGWTLTGEVPFREFLLQVRFCCTDTSEPTAAQVYEISIHDIIAGHGIQSTEAYNLQWICSLHEKASIPLWRHRSLPATSPSKRTVDVKNISSIIVCFILQITMTTVSLPQ